MADFSKLSLAVAKQKTQTLLAARRTHRVLIGCGLAIVVYALLGFFAVPPLVRHVAQQQISSQLERPTAIGRVAFNPFTLRFEIDGLHIADKAASAAGSAGKFVDIQRLVVRPSWSSLFHLAPIIKEVQVDSPSVSLIRLDAARFNFSDLIAKFSAPTPTQSPSKPARFAVSNIHIDHGQIHFDDQLLHVQHVVDNFSLGIPFVATLASATEIFVTPSLQARIDGSPLSIEGRTKPFSESKESDIALKLEQLDLPRLASYLPESTPVMVKSGRLSTDLDVRFSVAEAAPTIHISGTADLADFAATDRAGTPLADFKGMHLSVANAEPLRSVYALDEIRLSGPNVFLSRDANGVLNLQKIAASKESGVAAKVDVAKAAPVVQASASAPASSPGVPASGATAPSTAKPVPATPLNLSVKHVSISDGAVSLNDASITPHATLGLAQLAITVDGFSTLAKAPALFSLKTAIEHGGNLAVSGDVSLAAAQTHLKLALDNFALPPLQPYLPTTLAAKLTAGELSVALPIAVDWSTPQAAITVGAGSVSLHAVTVTPTGEVAPITVASAVATIQKIDVGARTAALDSIQISGLSLAAKRLKDGSIDLSTLTAKPPRAGHDASSAQPASATASEVASMVDTTPSATPAWHYQIGHVSLADVTAAFTDQSTARPVALRIAPLQLSVQSVSDDLHKPLTLNGQLTLNGNGSLGVNGTVTPEPLKLALHVDSKQLDVSTFEPYFGEGLNVSMASARLNASGNLGATIAATGTKNPLTVSYNGDVALTDVRMVDKASRDAVAGWKLLGASGLKLAYDARATRLDVSKITFARFYGRVLLDAQGKLNLRDVVASKPAPGKPAEVAAKGKQTPASSVEPATATASNSASEAVPTQAANQPGSTHSPTLRIGQVVLEDGRVTYSDNFVRPNYTANLLAINGTIGAFGSRSSTPAPVDVAASLSGNGPVTIKGQVNPLLDKPALDLTASAHDVELTDLTPYSSKYVGYPITRGKLNVDLHYALADNNLTANNHLFIDQLTFGNRIDAPGVTHLPVQLAVSLLKNSRGEIDVNIPVSGSLSNPEFSIGSVVWHAILNLVERAVTAPFTLLTHAFGGGTDPNALQYVRFEPGSAALTTTAQKKLDTIGSALASKPAIKMGLTAHVDARVDAPALRTAYLEDQVKLAKLKATAGHSVPANPDVSAVTVEANEYDKYLTAAYKAADFKKPRNLIGMTKTLPADEMEKALSDNAPAAAAALKALAQQRASAVQNYLGKQIDVKRITVAAVSVAASSSPQAGSPQPAPSIPPASSAAPPTVQPGSSPATDNASGNAADNPPAATVSAENPGAAGSGAVDASASTRVDFTLK